MPWTQSVSLRPPQVEEALGDVPGPTTKEMMKRSSMATTIKTRGKEIYEPGHKATASGQSYRLGRRIEPVYTSVSSAAAMAETTVVYAEVLKCLAKK